MQAENQLSKVLDLFREEPLDEEFARDTKIYTSRGISVISHPFYHQIFHVPERNAIANGAIRQKLTAIEFYSHREKVFDTLEVMYERPYRTDYLYTIFLWMQGNYAFDLPGIPQSRQYLQDKIKEMWRTQCSGVAGQKYFCELARSVWTDSENISQNLSEWHRIWHHTEDGSLWMDRTASKKVAALPRNVTLWRGECEDGGWSWSLSRKVASFFALRGINGSKGIVTKAVIPRELVYTYFGQRKEQEVIVLDDISGYIESQVKV